MTHIHERRFLKCPYVRARDYLRDSLETAANEKTVHTLPLTACLSFVPEPLEKKVLVRYERGRDPLHFDERWNVFWTPCSSGAFPDFAGEIAVRAEENYRGAILELTGEQSPPQGTSRCAFDVVLGARIASATAKALLEHIGAALEQRYENEARNKRNAV